MEMNTVYTLLLKDVNIAIPLSHGSAVGIMTGYVLDDRGIGVRVPVGSRILTSPYRPHRVCCSLNFLSNGYRRALSPGKAAGA
jgi:hypothetical protein